MTEIASVSSPLDAVLSRYWGFTSFRPLQREAMEAILAGRDSLVVLPTGGGKSLCFQAPALVRPGLAVIVSPLISLMKDQVDTLAGNGVPAALYNSSLSGAEKAAVVAGMRDGRYRLLYVSPERLVGEGSDAFPGEAPNHQTSSVADDVRRRPVRNLAVIDRRRVGERRGEVPEARSEDDGDVRNAGRPPPQPLRRLLNAVKVHGDTQPGQSRLTVPARSTRSLSCLEEPKS